MFEILNNNSGSFRYRFTRTHPEISLDQFGSVLITAFTTCENYNNQDRKTFKILRDFEIDKE